MDEAHSRISYEFVFLGIAILVTGIWSVAVIIEIFWPSHHVPETVTTVMPLVASGFYGVSFATKRRNGNNTVKSQE